jgi:dTMP kinase
MGSYIAFEGGEGSGKSTQAAMLAERLDAVLTREPGATSLGSELRRLLLSSGAWTVGARAEALLMAADRAQHLDEVVGPALAGGRHVVTDRSAYSSLAYQGGGRELGLDQVRAVNDWAIAGRWPDLVVYLRLPREVAVGRLDRTLDRLEREGEAFHGRVAAAFEALAVAEPERWLVIDADRSPREVADDVWSRLAPRLDGTRA